MVCGCCWAPQPTGSFSNPNPSGNVNTLQFLCSCAQDVLRAETRRTGVPAASLLELYSGNGNHTVALAGMFTAVYSVEIDGALCAAARE